MSIKYRELITGATLTGTASSLYVAPPLTSAVIHAVSIFNPTASPITFDLYKVTAGLTAGSPTKISSRIVPPGAVVTSNEAINHKMEAGTQLAATGAGLTLNVSGVEYIPD
ncbi:hypothetical protein [Pseudomonas sp. MONT-RG-20F-20-E-7-02]|uniref:hypothetical protein n=1 Tax=Pseudomonas sp. MONT-RG-20F-20-E-7-02 TaxID=2914979 RepID=UPI001F5A282E|nr:hypothetical protein [Pseudomonas sp. MONT-RG-20F-20-E-7-02]